MEPIGNPLADGLLDSAKRAWFSGEGDFAERMMADPRGTLNAMGVTVPADMEIVVVRETEDTRHMVIPPNPNVDLADESLSRVTGGTSAGSASSLGSASTAGSICTCASTASSAACAGTASSVS